MSNPFFDAMSNGQPTPNAQGNAQGSVATQPTPEQIQTTQQSIAAVKANPAGFIQQQFGLNVPQNANNPMQILQHLANSGQLNPKQMQMFQRVQGMGRR